MSFGLLDLMGAKLTIERDEKVKGLMGCWNAGHAGLLLAGPREKMREKPVWVKLPY